MFGSQIHHTVLTDIEPYEHPTIGHYRRVEPETKFVFRIDLAPDGFRRLLT